MKKKQIIGIVIIVFVVIGLGITLLLHNRHQENQEDSQEGQSTIEKEVSTDKKDEASEENDKIKTETEDVTDIRSWFEENPNNQAESVDKTTTTEKAGNFPYKIPNTSLSIRAVKSYSGIFIEDGSDKDVTNIAAIILDNKGTENIEYAKITLKCEGKEFVFEAKTLASGATTVVQESTGAKYVEGEYKEAHAQVAVMDKMEMSEKSIKVTETENGALQIMNISNSDIPCVRIFYKFYIEDLSVSVGGITYTSKITELKAGETRVITPSHYDKDASRVMMVRTYDTY